MVSLEDRRFTIAIIDDEADVKNRIEKIVSFFFKEEGLIKESNINFLQFNNAEDATLYFKNRGKADLILLDIHMTNGKIRDAHLNGDAFLRNLKKLEVLVPVIVLSTDPSEKKIIEMKKLGALLFIKKDEVFNPNGESPYLEVFKTVLRLRIETFNNELQILKINKELSETKDELKAIESAVKQTLLYSKTDKNEKITFVNNSFERLSGYDKEELIGQKHKILRSLSTDDGFIRNMVTSIRSGKIWSGIVENTNKFRKRFVINSTIVPVISSTNGDITGYINIATDVTELYNQAKKDDLTKLCKRNILFSEFVKSKNRYLSGDNRSSFLIFLDIDNFKNYNNDYSHEFGDKALVRVAELVMKNIRGTDFAIRWGGDEFIILINDSDEVSVKAIAERIRVSIENLILHEDSTGDDVNITVSGGIETIDFNVDINDIIKDADKLMYEAKEGGKNKIVFLK